MDLELKDYFKIDDSHSRIRGFLVVKDEDNKIIIKKENMIVKSGRKMILDGITGKSTLNIKSPTVKFSSDATLSSADMSSLNEVIDDVTVTVSCTDEDVNDTDLWIKYTILIDYDKSPVPNKTVVNSLGLFFGDKLFSRVVFDSIGLSNNRKLTFTYYIYF